METNILDITPEIALSFLTKNTANRRVSKKNVNAIKAAMAKGEWKFNGDPIRISKSGVLLDGQHRLIAISQMKGSYRCLVISGLDDDVFSTIDVGKKRSGSDALHVKGYKNTSVLSAICRMIITNENVGTPVGANSNSVDFPVSLSAIADFAESDDFVHESASFAQRSKTAARMFQNSNIGYAHYVFMQDCPSVAINFFEQLESGEYTYRNSPIKALRELFISFSMRGVKPSRGQKLAYLFKSYRAYKRSAQVKIIRLDKDSSTWFKI